MKPLNLDEVSEFASQNIASFHSKRLKSLEQLELSKLLKKNPYLFRAKNLVIASDLIEDLLAAFLSSSEEKLFGDFLEDLAIFVASKTCNGMKSSAEGIDLEFTNRGVHYLVSVKSGPRWGNSSQHRAQEQNFKTAVTRLKQSQHGLNVQPILGVCYGNMKTTSYKGVAYKVVGQNFWYLISENGNLYIEIIEPIGYRAKLYNDRFSEERARVVNLLTGQFMEQYCTDGRIDWPKLVEFNSGNLDIEDWYSTSTEPAG
jgi:hypothetical protein